MEVRTLIFLVFLTNFCFIFVLSDPTYPGSWKLLKKNAGISAMHIQLLPNSLVIALDRTDMGQSNISLPNRKCIKFNDSLDCTAHSVEIDPWKRSNRPLTIWSDTWCSSGSLSPDGVLVQSGGDQKGERVVRYLDPRNGTNADWREDRNGIIKPRWYASNQILPNGKIIVVGGKDQFNYEFIPKTSKSDFVLYPLQFLEETRYTDPAIYNNLYPFTHLSPDGNLFIFANDRAILLDYLKNKVIKEYPVIPGGFSRNYPSTGSSAFLPLKLNTNSTTTPEAEVLICGGTVPNAFAKAKRRQFLPATRTCGRISITSQNPNWVMEEMPFRRAMGDMILLPTGDVLIINGAQNGSAGWDLGREPILNPVLYHPDQPRVDDRSRFEILSPSSTPRMYHSTAILLPDGRVMVAGSNAHEKYTFTGLFPTDLSVEAFYPPYLSRTISRPRIGYLKPGSPLRYNEKFSVNFWLNKSGKYANTTNTYVTMVAPTFTTHSFAMNQRLLVLALDSVRHVVDRHHVADVNAPANAALAPLGYYLLFLVHEGVPSRGVWVQIK